MSERPDTGAAVPDQLLVPLLDAAADVLRALEPADVPAALRTLAGFDRRGLTNSAARHQLRRAMDLDDGFRTRVVETFAARPEVKSTLDGWTTVHATARAQDAAARDDLGVLTSALYAVRSYTSMREAWREWGRSIDLKDATSRARQWADVTVLVLAQALPLPMLVALAFGVSRSAPSASAWTALLVVNAVLLLVRLALLGALRQSYERPAWTFWLSPLADPAAVARIILSTLKRGRVWRGREYR